MANTYQIYLGRERGKRVVYKVGQAKKGCWTRCKNADYLIGMSFEIFPEEHLESKRTSCLNFAERFIIETFANNFPVEHGKEYFRASKYDWDKIKKFFTDEMTNYLERKNIRYIIHEGWVSPNTY